jgi:hypothetical protein
MDALACNIGNDRWSKARHEKSAEAIVGMRKHREGLNNQIPFKVERPTW